MKNPGFYVRTDKGNIGFTNNRDHYVNGKQIVYLVDEKFQPVKDATGKQKQILADRAKLELLGHID